jgi:hypothetical protein
MATALKPDAKGLAERAGPPSPWQTSAGTPAGDQESEHRGFAYWWRPGGMYLNLYLWLQNTMLTPVLFNGVLKMQVPTIPWEHLIAFTALYCALYMGGHNRQGDLRGSVCCTLTCCRIAAALRALRI